MNKLLLPATLAFCVFNTQAVMNPNTPLGKDTSGKMITYKDFEKVFIKELSKGVKIAEKNNEEIEAWDFIEAVNDIRCDVATELLGKAQSTEGLGDEYPTELFEAAMHVTEKCLMKEKSIFKAE